MRRLSPGDLVGWKGNPVDMIAPEVGIVVEPDSHDRDWRGIPCWRIIFGGGIVVCPETDVILLRGSRA